MAKKQVFITTGTSVQIVEKLLKRYEDVGISHDYADFGYTVLEYPEQVFEDRFKQTMNFLRDCSVWVTAVNVIVSTEFMSYYKDGQSIPGWISEEDGESRPFSNYRDSRKRYLDFQFS